MLSQINFLMRKEDGVTATEYALILALVAIAIIVAVTLLGTNLGEVFSKAANEI
jgi:pilus assembly protein Flp/PilA